MGLPSGWTRVRLGEVLEEYGGRNPKDGDLPVLSVTKNNGIMLASERFGKQIHGRDLSKYRVAPRDSIVVDPMLLWSGTIGRQKQVDAGLVSPDYRVYHVGELGFVPFMEHVSRGHPLMSQFQAGARGTNVRRNRISRSDFLALALDLPPLPEQRKIAAILSSVDEAIEATQAVIDQVQVVKKGLMQELLTKGLPGRHKKFKQTEIGRIPEEWEVTTIGDLAALSGGHGFRPPDWSDDGLPIIRIQNLNGSQDFNYYAKEPNPKWIVEPGELLFAWAGSRGASFGPCLWPGPRGLLNQHIHRVSPQSHVDQDFLYHLLVMVTTEVERKAHGFKETLVHLKKGELTGWKVGLPPIDQQLQIAKALKEHQRRLTAEEAYRVALESVKKTLMSVLFTGEIRASPDPV